jgi:hypothetical protein
MDRKKVKLIIGILAIVFFVIGVALLCVALLAGLNTTSAVIMGIVAGLCLILSVELGYMFWINMDSKANYFLYDSATKRNVPVQKLNFAVVNARTGRYLSHFAPSEGKIWNERILDNVDVDAEFKPLVAYKLLFSIADKDAEAGWNCLENASSKTIVFICEGLNANGDLEFSNTFGRMMAEKPLNMPMIRDYLVRNKKYMQSRMLKYVVENIELF